MSTITQEQLKKILEYDKNTGVFIWKKCPNNKKFREGKVAGGLDLHGYLRLKINGRIYKQHRLAWLYEYGYIPNMIDHINGVKSDNRIFNIRESTSLLNNSNKTKHKNNISGKTGVNWSKKDKKWYARIQVDKKRIFLGFFYNYSDALNARKNAEVLYGITWRE